MSLPSVIGMPKGLGRSLDVLSTLGKQFMGKFELAISKTIQVSEEKLFLRHSGIIRQYVDLNNSDVQSTVNQQLPRKQTYF